MEIVFDNVSYSYNKNTPVEKEALKDVSLKFKKSKINVIMGPSGSGKTTMIELINALLLPVKGKVSVGNFELMNNEKFRNINDLRFDVGLVFQFPEEQFFQSTVRKEIEFGMKYFKYKLDNSLKRVKEALTMVGLDDSYLNRNPFSLSSGEQRKVAIASILAFNPSVIILDEPTVGLDNKSKQNLIELIKILKTRYNKTIIIISHDVDLMYKIGEYFIILNNGAVFKSASKKTIFKNLKMFKKYNIEVPKIVEFIDVVYKKVGIKLEASDNIKDLMKGIYKNV